MFMFQKENQPIQHWGQTALFWLYASRSREQSRPFQSPMDVFLFILCLSKERSTESFLCHLWPSDEEWPMGKRYWNLRKGNPSTFLFNRNRLFSGSVNYGVFISSLDWQLLKNFLELLRTSVKFVPSLPFHCPVHYSWSMYGVSSTQHCYRCWNH